MTFYLQTTFSANCPSFSPFLWALDQIYEFQWLPKPKSIGNYEMYSILYPIVNLYLEELGDGNAINGVRFLTPKHLKKHVFHAGKITRLNISIRWRKKWIDRWTTRPHSRTGGGNRHFALLLLITILLPNWSWGALEAPWRPRLPLYMTFVWAQAFLAFNWSHEKASCTSGPALLRQFNIRGWFRLQLIFLESTTHPGW